MLKPRDAVLRMAPYSPPTSQREDKLRLDFNENTVGSSPKVIAALQERVTAGRLSVYPDYVDARREIAAFFQVAESEMLFTNGTDEAIQVLVQTYVDDHDDVLLLRPSYAMYRFYAEVAGAHIRELDYEPETLAFPLERLLAAIRPETKALLIANPNNPTGCAVSLDGIHRILEAAPRTAVLVDEAYYEFCGITALGEIAKYPNLFVSRTFSKVYGIAGMRIGCLFSQAANVQHLHKAQSPYSVNSVATLAARAAIQDPEYIRNYVREALDSRAYLYRELAAMGIPTYPSEANFVLMRLGDRAIEVRDKLRTQGILVRDRSYELPGCVRVTVGTRAQMDRFLTAFREVWG